MPPYAPAVDVRFKRLLATPAIACPERALVPVATAHEEAGSPVGSVSGGLKSPYGSPTYHVVRRGRGSGTRSTHGPSTDYVVHGGGLRREPTTDKCQSYREQDACAKHEAFLSNDADPVIQGLQQRSGSPIISQLGHGWRHLETLWRICAIDRYRVAGILSTAYIPCIMARLVH